MTARGYGTVDNDRVGKQFRTRGFFPCTNSCVAVPQDMYYAVEHFGEFQYILDPGCAWLCGCCYGLRAISRRVEQNDVIIGTKTSDNVFVQVRVAVQQSVSPKEAREAIYELANVGAQVDSYVADVVRSQVPLMTLDESFEKKDGISNAVLHALEDNMAKYGFRIHKALVTEITPSKDIQDSMNEINKQKRLRDAAVMAAEAEKVRVVTAASAAADAACLQGEGIARQRSAIVQGLRESITQGTDETLTSEKISELLLISQYFETLKEVGANSKSNAICIPHSPSEGGVSQIRTVSAVAAQKKSSEQNRVFCLVGAFLW